MWRFYGAGSFTDFDNSEARHLSVTGLSACQGFLAQ